MNKNHCLRDPVIVAFLVAMLFIVLIPYLLL